jgi:MFS family permease
MRFGTDADHEQYKWWALSCTSLGMLLVATNSGTLMTTLESSSSYWQSGIWLALVGIGSGMFMSPNTAAMMGTVPTERRGIAAGTRTMVQNTGAVISIAFVLAIVTAAVPKPVLFKVFSGLASGLSSVQLEPFVHNMHTALWALAGVSLLGAVVSLLRPTEWQRTAGRERGAAARATREAIVEEVA